MLRQRMRCDAPPFSPADYDHIMQCAEKKPRDKVLKDLTDKYRTSQNVSIRSGEVKKKIELRGINQFICQQLRFLI